MFYRALDCHVEWIGSSNLALQEYNTCYADGYVETYLAVPSSPTPFAIHLTSRGYIAPGLAMFVYIDGVYQCNRNRHNLLIPALGTKQKETEIDFHVRQKEERKGDEAFHGKAWKFEKATPGKSRPKRRIFIPNSLILLPQYWSPMLRENKTPLTMANM